MVLSPSNQHPTLKPAYLHANTNPRRNLSTPLISHLLPAYNASPRLPLATPEDSDLDAASIVSTWGNTFSSNISYNTVIHISPAHLRSVRSATFPHARNGTRDSTTLNAAPSIACTSFSSYVAAATYNPHSRGTSLVRRSTFPRPQGSASRTRHTSRIYSVTLLDGETIELSLKRSAIGSDLLHKVCQYLTLRENEFFSLYFFKHPSLDVIRFGTSSTTSFSRRMPLQMESTEECAIHHRGIPFWLKMDRRIVDQCKKNTQFWFGVRIYPPKLHANAYDEMTLYQICLQLRQNLLSGRLACSFFTHTLLAAYWAQSELGDCDHYSLAACLTFDYLLPLHLAAPPIADSGGGGGGGGGGEADEEQRWRASRTGPPEPPPSVRLSTRFLQQVALFHRALRSLIPSRADLLFLQEAQKLSTYGIDFHRIQSLTNSTVRGNFTRRLTKEMKFQRSQSLRLNTVTKAQNPLSLSPFHHLPESVSKDCTPHSTTNKPCASPTLPLACSQQYPLFLGVFHGGIYTYRGRLRLEHYPWPRILKMTYQRASFRLYLRLTNSEKDGLVRVVKYDCGTTALAKRIYRSSVDHHALFRLHRLNGGERSVSWVSQGSFPFTTETHLRRLHPPGATTFLTPAPSSPSAVTSPLSSIATRTAGCLGDRPTPLSEPDIRAPNIESPSLLDRRGSRIFRSAHKFFHSLFHKYSQSPVAQPPSRCLQSFLSDQAFQQPAKDDEQTSLSATTVSSASPFYTLSEWNRPSLPGPLWRMSPVDATAGLLFELSGGLTVSPDWRLFVNQNEAEKMSSTEWRGCRATWGISETPRSSSAASSCSRRLFYEVRLNGDEPVRIGWATKNASLILGEDTLGFAYQTSSVPSSLNKNIPNDNWFKIESNGEGEEENQSYVGALIIGGASVNVIGSYRSDVIGCYLDLDARLAHWTRNGVTAADMTISIGRFPPKTVFFPACAIRTSSITFNFGDAPFAYGPMLLTGEHSHSNWLPLASANLIAEISGCSYASPIRHNKLPIRLTPNPRSGWHLVPSNSPGLILSPDRLCARALHHFGWQTFYASEAVTFSNDVLSGNTSLSQPQIPGVYFEVSLLESFTTTPGAGIFMGFSTSKSTASAYPIGSDCVDTFGLVFEQTALNSQTCLIHGGIKQTYGRALHRGDIIGCTLNPQHGLVFWSINGEYLGHTVQVCGSTSNAGATADDVICIPLRQDQSFITFNLLFCLANTTIEVNFGDGATSLKHLCKQTNCVPLSLYRHLLDGWRLPQQCVPLPSRELNPILKKNDHYHIPPNRNKEKSHECPLGFHKSTSCPSSTITGTKGVLTASDVLGSDITLRSKIPLASMKTRLGCRNFSESAPHKPITSPTFAAPWSRTDQILPIVCTHRIAASALLSGTGVLETDIDNPIPFATSESMVAVDDSLCRSVSDSMIRHLCDQSQQYSISVTNKSSSSSLIERRIAQIPVVPTRIVRPRAVELPVYRLLNVREKEPNDLIVSATTSEAGEETIDRRRHVTDLTLPTSTVEDCRRISSSPLVDVS